MTINREHFEAWLFSQPGEKVLNYREGSPNHETGCLLCNYLRENFKQPFYVGGSNLSFDGENAPLPDWFQRLMFQILHLHTPQSFTIAEAQAEYLKLFPDTVVSSFETNPALVTAPTPEEKEVA